MKRHSTMLYRALLRSCTLWLLLTMLLTGVCAGQTQTPTPTPTPAPTPAPTAAASSAPTPAAIAKVREVNRRTVEADQKKILKLGHEIEVKVDHLEALLREVNGDLQKLVLHVDGHPLTGVTARRLSIGGVATDTLVYNLAPPANDEQRKAWHALLGRPSLLPPTPRDISVSVGQAGRPIESAETGAKLEIVESKWLWVFLIALATLIIGFYLLAQNSDLLRDAGPDPWKTDENGTEIVLRKPYSLARTQMALWFFIVFASYLFIWLVTDSLVSLTAQVLGLIGISAGTAAGAAVIDANKRGALEKQKNDLEKRKNALTSELASLNEQVAATKGNVKLAAGKPQELALAAELATLQADLAAKQTMLTQVREELAKLESSAKPLTSQNFFVDILSDDYGVSFHRFQIFVWTLALIIIFITSVYKVLTIPLFDVTLLALMGISSGTYLMLKVPEPRTPPADGAPTTALATGAAAKGMAAVDAAPKKPGGDKA